MTTTTQQRYDSKSGVEIQAVFNDTIFGDMHMIKFATQRDTANVHVMGSVDPVSVAKGKRSTTGACVFAVFDKDRLLDAVKSSNVFLTNHELVNYGGQSATVGGKTVTNDYNGGNQIRVDGTLGADAGRSIRNTSSVFDTSNFGKNVAPMLIDQIPPFDITLVGVSESTGQVSRMVIHGVQFNSDQGGSSVDELILQRQVTFLASRVTPWQNVSDLANGTSAGL